MRNRKRGVGVNRIPFVAVAAVLGTAVFGCGSNDAGQEAPPGPGNAIHEHLMQAAARGFSGAVVVSQGGEVILSEGYGWTDADQKAEITPATLFYVGSITKGFTAAAVLKLQERGLLDVGDPLSRFFPDVSGPFAGITLHQLLTHQAGIGRTYAVEGVRDRQTAVNAITTQPLDFEPGSRFSYADDGYSLLAAVVEAVSERSFEDFLQSEVFAPAGMADIGFWGMVDDLDPYHVAQKQGEVSEKRRRAGWAEKGAKGIFASASSLAKWQQAVSAMNPESRNALLGPHVDVGRGTGLGYGWYRSTTDRGTTERGSRGENDFGHNAVIRWFVDEDAAIVVATNAGMLGGEEASQKISEEIEEILFRPPPEPSQ